MIGETKTLIKILIALTVFSLISYMIYTGLPGGEPDISLDYTATLYPNGYLVETYNYHVRIDDKYTMLYRYWKEPLTYGRILNKPHISLIDVTCSPKGIAYIKDYNGKVWILSNTSNDEISEIIKEKAYNNEAGCFYPQGVKKGEYTIKYIFLIKPPVQCNNMYCHLNLKLADEHIRYDHIHVEIIDKQDSIKYFYVHVPEYNVSRINDRIVVTGVSPENRLLEIEFLYLKNSNYYPYSFISEKDNIVDEVISTNNMYYTIYEFLNTLSKTYLLISLIFPIIALIIYYFKGREKTFTVPEYLSYIPNKDRKPWLVNLLFHGDSMTIDQNAFYATVLDLARRGILEISGDENKVVVKIKREPMPGELDRYEEKVYRFLKKWSMNNVFDIKELVEKAKRMDRAERRELYNDMISLVSTPKWMMDLAKQYLEVFSRKIFGLFFLILLVSTIIFAVFMGTEYEPYRTTVIALSIILMIQNAIIGLAPSQLFGRWKGDYYKEKLEWDAFRNLLKDFAMIQKYKPADLSIWDEWLIYGTALGVGKKVVEAMKKLNIPLTPSGYYVMHTPKYYNSLATTTSPSGGSGAGGGFGGGGGGAR